MYVWIHICAEVQISGQDNSQGLFPGTHSSSVGKGCRRLPAPSPHEGGDEGKSRMRQDSGAGRGRSLGGELRPGPSLATMIPRKHCTPGVVYSLPASTGLQHRELS